MRAGILIRGQDIDAITGFDARAHGHDFTSSDRDRAHSLGNLIGQSGALPLSHQIRGVDLVLGVNKLHRDLILDVGDVRHGILGHMFSGKLRELNHVPGNLGARRNVFECHHHRLPVFPVLGLNVAQIGPNQVCRN